MRDGPFRRVRPLSDVLVQKMPDGDSVLLHTGSEVYFGLDVIGTKIWEGLAADLSYDDIVARLIAEYDVAADRLHADLRQLIERLVDAGLVEVSDE